ncbi:hypothetical protein JCM24511_02060 [Saitozyma sp. JCM 24511]|nr:hypothetical protein JCM24511_02060 [Saitozyma sp. JCM 24511]
MLEGVDETRFTSLELARPNMTSLPHPLLHLSHQKLDWLEPHVGPREGMTDWWIIDKEEGEEEEQQEDYYEEGWGTAWFEELLANIRQDEYTSDDGRAAECTESSVSKAVYDLEYQSEGMVAYTIPVSLSRPSPTTLLATSSSLASSTRPSSPSTIGGFTTFLFGSVAVSGIRFLAYAKWTQRDGFIATASFALGLAAPWAVLLVVEESYLIAEVEGVLTATLPNASADERPECEVEGAVWNEPPTVLHHLQS